jgi:putative hydrolase of the HAD superfamily
MEWLPEAVAHNKGISLSDAKKDIYKTSKELYGTLPWYELKFWEDRYETNLIAIAEKNKSYAMFIDGAHEALQFITSLDKKVFFLTNCDSRLLKVKSSQVPLLNFADNWISSVDIGVVKEDQKFWKIALEKLNIQPSKSIFFDDNINIVNAATKYGIKKSVHVTEPTNNNSVIYESNAKIQIRKLSDLIRTD